MSSQERMEFPAKCKALRKERRLRAKEVAEVIGRSESTVYNMECNNFKTVQLDCVYKLAELYHLNETATQQLVEAWNALPASAYNEANRPRWERNKAKRNKAKRHDLLEVSLLEVLACWLGDRPEGPCACPDPDPFAAEPAPPCELCTALALFDLKWTTWSDVIGQLDEIRGKLQP